MPIILLPLPSLEGASVDDPKVFLAGLVFEADRIQEVDGLGSMVQGLRGVAGEDGFKPLTGRSQAISVLLASMHGSMRTRVAEEIVGEVARYLAERGLTGEQVAVRYVYAMRFSNHLFTDYEVSLLRTVPHALVSQIIGFEGANFLQVWLKELLSADQALNVLLVVAAQTGVGFL